MKSPDVIKKGLGEAIAEASWVVDDGDMHDLRDALDNARANMADALVFIQKLEAGIENLSMIVADAYKQRDRLAERVKQLEAERDAAMTFLRGIGCDTCRYREVESWEEPCLYCIDYARWQWRGVQKEE